MRHKDDVENSEDGLATFMAAYDWKNAMEYSDFKFEEIEEILYTRDGENDGEHWLLIVKLKNGKFGWLNAWCDYSGWDCQSGGCSGIVESKEEAERCVNE